MFSLAPFLFSNLVRVAFVRRRCLSVANSLRFVQIQFHLRTCVFYRVSFLHPYAGHNVLCIGAKVTWQGLILDLTANLSVMAAQQLPTVGQLRSLRTSPDAITASQRVPRFIPTDFHI